MFLFCGNVPPRPLEMARENPSSSLSGLNIEVSISIIRSTGRQFCNRFVLASSIDSRHKSMVSLERDDEFENSSHSSFLAFILALMCLSISALDLCFSKDEGFVATSKRESFKRSSHLPSFKTDPIVFMGLFRETPVMSCIRALDASCNMCIIFPYTLRICDIYHKLNT